MDPAHSAPIDASFSCLTHFTHLPIPGQVVPSQLQPEVARAVGYAAGRYMHVMFPENAHEVWTPVWTSVCAGCVGKERASRIREER